MTSFCGLGNLTWWSPTTWVSFPWIHQSLHWSAFQKSNWIFHTRRTRPSNRPGLWGEMMILIKMKFVTIVTILTTTRRGVRRKEEAPPTPTGSESPRFSTASLFGFDSEFRHMDNLLWFWPTRWPSPFLTLSLIENIIPGRTSARADVPLGWEIRNLPQNTRWDFLRSKKWDFVQRSRWDFFISELFQICLTYYVQLSLCSIWLLISTTLSASCAQNSLHLFCIWQQWIYKCICQKHNSVFVTIVARHRTCASWCPDCPQCPDCTLSHSPTISRMTISKHVWKWVLLDTRKLQLARWYFFQTTSFLYLK